MQPSLKLAALSVLAVGIGWPLAASPFKEQPVNLAADDWCPQHCQGNAELKGYVVDIVGQALEAEGVPYKVSYLPWLRAMHVVEVGTYDGLLTPTVKGYSQFLFHDEAVGYQEYCFYTNLDSTWKYAAPKDLLGTRVAFLKESGLGDLDGYLAAHKGQITVIEFAGTSDFTTRIFDFLAAKRTDSIIMTSDVHHYSVKRSIIKDNFRDAGCLGREKLAVGLSPANPARSKQIGAAIDSGIRKLKKSGQLAKILERYGMEPWKD